MNNFFVYLLKDPDTLQVFYVGKGKGNRAKQHSFPSMINKPGHKNNKIRKLQSENKNYLIEYHSENLSEEQAFDKEKELIAYYGRLDNGSGVLTNHTDGGEGNPGWSDDRKILWSEFMKDQILVTDENGIVSRIHKNDSRWLSGELKGVNYGKKLKTMKRGFIVCKDSKGNVYSVEKNDPRWLSGELVGIMKGIKAHPNTVQAAKDRKGIPKPEGFGEKIRQSLKGKPKSEAHKEALRKSLLKYNS